MDLQKLGERIREIRKLKKISQADIAAQLDISITAFSKIERGLTNISINRLEEIAQILGISIINLLFEPIQENTIQSQNELYIQLEKELEYSKELLKAKDEIIDLLKNKLKV
ncbi:MAG TPA: helix-turn-helix transcriptional regulator [Bacteroidales bacterium]|nr:helix-turn-helix transcriptional regulator [Bacteroidales bacterium]